MCLRLHRFFFFVDDGADNTHLHKSTDFIGLFLGFFRIVKGRSKQFVALRKYVFLIVLQSSEVFVQNCTTSTIVVGSLMCDLYVVI